MKNTHEFYSKAAEVAKIGIWEIDLKTKSVYWDTITRCILEVPDYFRPTLENGIEFYKEGKNRERIQTLLLKALDEGAPFREKFQITTFQNNLKYIECVCRVEMLLEKPHRIFGTFHDITKEENLINALQLNVEKFSSIFSSANDAIFIFDIASGLITDCNPRATELTEYPYEDLIGLHHYKLFPLEHRDSIETFLDKHLAKDNFSVKETFIITKTKTLIPVEVATGKKYQVENQTFLVCFFRDISKRKNVEDEMHLLSLVASETTDSIVIADENGIAIWANKAHLKLTKFELSEIIGHKPGYFSKGPGTDKQTTDRMRQAIIDKKSIKVTILNYTKKKEEYWFELNITPVFNTKNKCTNFVGVGRDVTNRKVKELEMKRLLEVTSQQNDKLFNFSHIVSHNIRSHSSNLSMVVDIMENTPDLDEKLTYFDLFKEGTEKLSETIEYLNDIITIQNHSNIEKKHIFLKDEIEKTKSALSLSLIESQIKITDNIPKDLTVFAIPAYLDSILLNLFTNAVKYKAIDKEAILDISYEIRNNYKIISFKDNGVGINLEKNGHKIFGMYKTFHGNEDAKGIGLFITKNQIEAMNGKIKVKSELGIGTIFKIYLNEK